MNFLKKLFNIGSSSKKPKSSIKLTPEVLAAKARIAARKEKEEKEFAEQERKERLLNVQGISQRMPSKQSLYVQEEVRRLEKRAVYAHNDKLSANSEMIANSRMDFWNNTIAREEPPDTIAPDMLIPESPSEHQADVETENNENLVTASQGFNNGREPSLQ